MPKRRVNIQFPLAGVNRTASYQQQPPFTTPDALNVIPFGNDEHRMRGGSRPGLMRAYKDDGTLSGPIRALTNINFVADSGPTEFIDDFREAVSFATNWGTLKKDGGAVDKPTTFDDQGIYAAYDSEIGAQRAFTLGEDADGNHALGLLVLPYQGRYHNAIYRLHFNLDPANDDWQEDGHTIQLTIAQDRTYALAVYEYNGGSLDATVNSSGTLDAATPFLFAAWRHYVGGQLRFGVDVEETSHDLGLSGEFSAVGGLAFGFSIDCNVSGQRACAAGFRWQSLADNTSTAELRSRAIVSINDNVLHTDAYRDDWSLSASNRMDYLHSGGVGAGMLGGDNSVTLVQRYKDVLVCNPGPVIASGTGTLSGDGGGNQILDATVEYGSLDDYNAFMHALVLRNLDGYTVPLPGTYQIVSIDGTSIDLGFTATYLVDCEWYITRNMFVWDSVEQSASQFWSNQFDEDASDTYPFYPIPDICPIACLYRDCLVLAGGRNDRRMWYMSRQGDIQDFNFAQSDATDPARPVAGFNADAGGMGRNITALIPFSDDYLIMASLDELWVMRGHPASGGVLDRLSGVHGIIGKDAWTTTPDGSMIFLSRHGLLQLPPGGGHYPQPLSPQRIPRDLMNRTDTWHRYMLIYDNNLNGVWIVVGSVGNTKRYSWYYDIATQSFWPLWFHPNVITAVGYGRHGEVLFGLKTGEIVRPDEICQIDHGGNRISSHVFFGAFAPGGEGGEGLVDEVNIALAEDSGSVKYGFHAADTAEGALTVDAAETGYLTGGRNYVKRPRVRGASVFMKLENDDREGDQYTRAWMYEAGSATLHAARRQRLM